MVSEPRFCDSVVRMAEGTRLKLVDEKLLRHDEILELVLTSQQEFCDIQTGIQGTLELILDRLTTLERLPNRAQGDNCQGDRLLPLLIQEMRSNINQIVTDPPSIWELPSFEGHEPKVDSKM